MAKTPEQLQFLSILEDTATLLQKTQINLKKCPKVRLTKGYVETRITIIDDYWKTFRNAHQQLVKITPKEKRGTLEYFLNEEFYIYEDLYNVLQGDLKDMLVALSSQANMDQSFERATQSVGHLPRIILNTFSGGYEEWPAFKDLFISLVHNNASLNDVQKLHYLKTSLKSEAEILLKHVQVTSNNYMMTWDILNTRYGNKRLILNSVLKRLFNQRKMTSPSAVQIKGLLDTTRECLNSLQNLDITISSWDPIIIFLLVQKLDPETHKSWEDHAYKDDAEALPTWDEFKKFLESKFRILELVTSTTRDTKTIKERTFHAAVPVTKTKTCFLCKNTHTLCHCKQFSEMEPNERCEYVKTHNLCYNCLVPGHSVSRCKVPMSCRICHRRHHSLLHIYKTEEPMANKSSSQPLVSTHVAEENIKVNTMVASQVTTKQHAALLATAVVQATSKYGNTIPLRALIDPGSQATFISEKATQLLKLEREHIKGTVIGVGSSRTEIKHVVQLQITSHQDQTFTLPIQAYVMSKQITTKIPARTINPTTWAHIQGLHLADPNYFRPGSIDLLLGVREYAQILQQECVKGPPGTPTAQKTSLGWILFGDTKSDEVKDTKSHKNSFIVMHHQVNVEDMLKRLWEIDIDNNRHLTQEEKRCEDIYEKTTSRNKEGRYVVTLPFKTECPQSPHGNTKEIARQRFAYLERRFRKSPDLKEDYTKEINEYIDKGYLEQVPETEKQIKMTVYLPHHVVVRKDKETSQHEWYLTLRVKARTTFR